MTTGWWYLEQVGVILIYFFSFTFFSTYFYRFFSVISLIDRIIHDFTIFIRNGFFLFKEISIICFYVTLLLANWSLQGNHLIKKKIYLTIFEEIRKKISFKSEKTLNQKNIQK